MFFLSQVLGRTIYDAQEVKIGKIIDVVVEPSEDYPPLVGLEVADHEKRYFIHAKYIELLGEQQDTINIHKEHIDSFSPQEDDLYLAKDLFERQIVDLKGVKIVRVNDVQLGKIDNQFCVISLAVGNKSIFRRLGLDFLASWLRIEDRFIKWDDINLVDASQRKNSDLQLRMIKEELSQLHPADIANIVEDLNSKQRKQFVEAISHVSEELAADVFEEIDSPQKLKNIVLEMNPDQAANIVENMEPDEAADLMADLPDDKAEEILNLMHKEESEEIQQLMVHDQDTVGALMSTEYVAVPETYTLQQTIDHLKKVSEEYNSIYYVYAIDQLGVLQGVISVRTLLIDDPKKVLKDIMQTNMLTVSPTDDRFEAIKKLTRYNLLSICVVDSQHVMRGIVTADDALRILVPEA